MQRRDRPHFRAVDVVGEVVTSETVALRMRASATLADAFGQKLDETLFEAALRCSWRLQGGGSAGPNLRALARKLWRSEGRWRDIVLAAQEYRKMRGWDS